MPDRLYEGTERAIDQRVDGHLFQRCAIGLLREAYLPDPRGTLAESEQKDERNENRRRSPCTGSNVTSVVELGERFGVARFLRTSAGGLSQTGA